MKLLALLSATIALTVYTDAAYAASWRCADDPALPECEEALINDIEDTVDSQWPWLLSLPMSPIPYTCTKRPGSGYQITPDKQEEQIQVVGQISWSVHWQGDLRSFLIGRYTAAADVLATVIVSGRGVEPLNWPSTVANYVFQESSTDVMAPAGSTGVADLGAIQYQTTTGDFWTAELNITMDWLADGYWTCAVGREGYRQIFNGTNVVRAHYPVAWTLAEAPLAEAIREQFRSAVRFVVIGTP